MGIQPNHIMRKDKRDLTELAKKEKTLSRMLKLLAPEKELQTIVSNKEKGKKKMGLRYVQEGLAKNRGSDTLELF